MRQWTESALIEIKAWHLVVAIIWVNVDLISRHPLGTHFNGILIRKIQHWHSGKCIWKCRLQCPPFILGLNVFQWLYMWQSHFLPTLISINSLWPSGAILNRNSWSTLGKVNSRRLIFHNITKHILPPFSLKRLLILSHKDIFENKYISQITSILLSLGPMSYNCVVVCLGYTLLQMMKRHWFAYFY